MSYELKKIILSDIVFCIFSFFLLDVKYLDMFRKTILARKQTRTLHFWTLTIRRLKVIPEALFVCNLNTADAFDPNLHWLRSSVFQPKEGSSLQELRLPPQIKDDRHQLPIVLKAALNINHQSKSNNS